MSKNSTRDALNRFYQKDADEVAQKPASSKKKVRNKEPEKDVERECSAGVEPTIH